MSQLWTPVLARRHEPKVSRQHREGTRAWEAQVLGSMHMVGGILDYWTAELKKIDPNLRLMQAREHANCAGVIAGFYHFVRLREPGRDEKLMVIPLRHPATNEFVEPTSDMLEALKMCDLQNDQIREAQRVEAMRLIRSQERAAENEKEERRDEGRERFLAASRTQVLMSSDVPWSQNQSAASRRDKGERAKRSA